MDTVKIMGVKINTFTSKTEVLDIISEFLVDGQQHFVVTANAEILLATQHDEEYFYIINKADLVIPDGSGPQIACALTGSATVRFAGADLTPKLLELSAIGNKKIAILIWKNGLARGLDIESILAKSYPNLPILVKEIERTIDLSDIEDIDRFQPDILLVGLGAPWQEKLIFHNLSKLPSVKLAVGVGGSFDFITGKIKRAPAWLRNIGLEWLWRLACQPWRWKRIVNAIVIFPLIFVKQHFLNRFLFRKNVVALVTKDYRQALLLNWARDDDYWSLPQGGVNFRESRQEAITRELREEIGTDKFEIMFEYKNIHSYFWPKDYFHFGNKGQKQTLYLVKFLGRDEDINLHYWDHKAWRWVELDKLISESHPVHRPAYTIFLQKYNEFINKEAI